MRTRTIVVVVSLLLAAVTVAAQESGNEEDKNLESTLERLSRDLAKAYVAPIVSGFGSNQNAGWFHRAPKATAFDFDLEFGLVAMTTLFTAEHRHFNTSGVFQFDSAQAHELVSNINDPNYNNLSPAQKEQARQELINQLRGKDFTVTVSGATIIGDKDDSLKVGFNGGQFTYTDALGQQRTVTIPSHLIALPVGGLLGDATLFGKQMVPLASPQLSIGTLFGTQLTFRYFPDVELDEEVGKLKFFGFGIQHNPAVWFDTELPVDIAASFFTQTLQAGSIFEAKATAFGVNASTRLGWGFFNLTPYVGFMVESSSMKFTYDYEVDSPTGKIPQQITFELEGENSSRLTLGLGIKLLIVNVNADYNIGTYNSFSAGVMIII